MKIDDKIADKLSNIIAELTIVSGDITDEKILDLALDNLKKLWEHYLLELEMDNGIQKAK